MLILGVHYYGHNTSVCLFKNNNLIFAIEEERLSRKKNDGAVPYKSITYILKKFNLKINDINAICCATIPERLIKEKYLKFTINNFKLSKNIFFEKKSIQNIFFLKNFEKNFKRKLDYKNKIFFFNHHLCHMYAAYYLSGFKKCICISIDGLGEIEATAIGIAHNNNINIEKKINYPHSLGKVYEAITFFLKFNPNTASGTVMALAAYGNPNAKLINGNTYYNIFKKIIKKDKRNLYKVDLSWFNYPYTRKGWVSKKFVDFFQNNFDKKNISSLEHKRNIAAALQKRFEDIYLLIINFAKKKYNLNKVVISGGCALNCKANGELYKLKIKETYIQPAAGDAGLSIGAAKIGYELLKKNKKITVNKKFKHTYFGPEVEKINSKLIKYLKSKNLNYQKIKNIEKFSANLLSKGKVIGWVQGKMEFGPRALGNRSILACTNNIKIKDHINKNIKNREMFRPFAPAVLSEKKNVYFKNIKNNSYFMLTANIVKTNKKEDVIATTHIDGSARVQLVEKNLNKRFYKLIYEYYKITKIPVLLNTSFNGKDIPIVCTSKDAINEFLRIKLDYLIINDYCIYK
jgi:carbamoyltransferase